MVLFLLNVFRINIVLLILMVNFFVILVIFWGNVCIDKILYFVFLYFGSGYYDLVVEDVINV